MLPQHNNLPAVASPEAERIYDLFKRMLIIRGFEETANQAHFTNTAPAIGFKTFSKKA